MKNIILAITAAVILCACEKTVILDLNENTPRIIIEGQVTNQPGYQYVKVSRSGGFYQTGPTPRVEDAIVTVSDDLGTSINFIHNPGGRVDSVGYYVPENSFTGSVGRHYKLSVVVDGQSYAAEDTMMPVTAIDSLGVQLDPDEEEDPKDYGRFHEVLLFAKEPQQTVDYYLFRFYRNDSLKVYNDTDIYFADDELLGENIDGVSSPIYYTPGDVARVEMYSISRNAFVFYTDLQALLNNDGGLFTQPPSNSRTNLTNGALGFFQASAVTMKQMTIKE